MPTPTYAPVHVPAAGPLAVALLACSCASYPERVAPAMAAFEQADFDRAAELFADEDRTGSEFLAGAEAGMSWLAAGEWPQAAQALERAALAVRGFEDRGPLSLSSGAETATSLIFNDTTRAYQGEGFERLLLHAALGLAYLAQGDLDGLRVEVRRTDALLTSEEQLYETEYAAGGLASFLSATSYLLEEDLDDALIDYRRMLDRGVGVQLAGPEALRLARALDRQDLLADLEDRFDPTPVPPGAPEPAWVVVVAGLGLAPVKFETNVSIPTSAGFVSFSAPQYASRPSPIHALRIRDRKTGANATTVTVEDVETVARENLEDRLGAVALRSAARNAARLALRKQFTDDDKHGAAALVDLWSIFTERADLRSWWTLPGAWHATRMALPPGVCELELEALGGGSGDLGAYELLPGETLFVFARTVGPHVHAHPIGGGRLEEVPAAFDIDSLPQP